MILAADRPRFFGSSGHEPRENAPSVGQSLTIFSRRPPSSSPALAGGHKVMIPPDDFNSVGADLGFAHNPKSRGTSPSNDLARSKKISLTEQIRRVSVKREQVGGEQLLTRLSLFPRNGAHQRDAFAEGFEAQRRVQTQRGRVAMIHGEGHRPRGVVAPHLFEALAEHEAP